MSMPSGKNGKTAGPSFEIESPVYISSPEVAMNDISRHFEDLGKRSRECEVIHSSISEMFEFYANFFANLANNPDIKFG